MRDLEFIVEGWLGPDSDPTLASVRLEAGSGPDRTALTEVEDQVARTVRQNIFVPLHPVARWLLVNWWRLRWEPHRVGPGWRFAHSMASIGGGYAWPPVEFSSDGEFIQLQMLAERTPDVASIRYLTDVTINVSSAEFEAAVDGLSAQVQDRLSACGQFDRDMEGVRSELAAERADPTLARACRLQACAGMDPGTAPDGWLRSVDEVSETTGPAAIGEVMAVLPDLQNDIDAARRRIEVMRASPARIDLSWIEPAAPGTGRELPWQRGARLAASLRLSLGVGKGPLTNGMLGGRLGVTLPLPSTARQPLGGGVWNGTNHGSTPVVIPTPHLDGQRFYLARLVGAALVSAPGEHLLPVTGADTAMQKLERAFAQELLAPWCELDDFTDAYGLGDDTIAEAADYFEVSERLILTTLVNRKKLPRSRLGVT